MSASGAAKTGAPIRKNHDGMLSSPVAVGRRVPRVSNTRHVCDVRESSSIIAVHLLALSPELCSCDLSKLVGNKHTDQSQRGFYVGKTMRGSERSVNAPYPIGSALLMVCCTFVNHPHGQQMPRVDSVPNSVASNSTSVVARLSIYGSRCFQTPTQY